MCGAKWIAVLRRVPILVVAAIFGIGPIPLQQVHVSLAQRAWQKHVTVPTARGAVPLKRTPMRPGHDPACVVCQGLHSPAWAVPTAAMPLEVHERSGAATIWAATWHDSGWAPVAQCRGPPAV